MASGDIFLCEDCSKQFNARGGYNRHRKTHSKPYPCDKCARRFALRSDLKRHALARHRLGQSKYDCSVETCTFKATRKDNLRQHIRQIHPTHFSKQERGTKQRDLLLSLESAETSAKTRTRQQPLLLPTMLQAASTGNIPLLVSTLDAGIDLSMEADDGSTALHCAVKTNQLDMIQFLIRMGAELETRNLKWRTPLYEAVLSRHQPTIALLVASGAKLTKELADNMISTDQFELIRSTVHHIEGNRDISRQEKSPDEVSFLHKLVSGSQTDFDWNSEREHHILRRIITQDCTSILSHLLDSGKLNPNFRFRSSSSLLHIAAMRGCTKTLKLLLTCKNTVVNRRDRAGYIPLERAAHHGHLDLIQILLADERIGYEEMEKNKRSLLRASAFGRQWSMVDFLLSSKAESAAFESTPSKTTTLTKEEAMGIVRRLLSYKDFSINEKDRDERTLLHIAAQHDDASLVELLLDHDDVQVNSMDNRGEAALNVAAQSGSCRALQSLLKHEDVGINYRSYDGSTALHDAVWKNQISAVQLLLNHKDINPELHTISGSTALDLAKRYGRTEIVNLLEAYGAKGSISNEKQPIAPPNEVIPTDNCIGGMQNTDETDLNFDISTFLDLDFEAEMEDVGSSEDTVDSRYHNGSFRPW
ncbi:ankyrin [Dothidotthia symphoricarpi CBS 119687]|uniref:Ankyrin n=1 Tax=Dothidotthia symphoricarpi CBS 119687 TaxID=1392245 RepID=A0A6A6A962_9PLEO|nr:ankyrin [Dothidotthia symphoricarpi CBS 119687]KAF2127735.1 ankyrin [Dothidotthia symphoricarpi CBS 119687]